MSEELLQKLIEKTDTLIKLQAMNAVKNFDMQKDKIEYLSAAGIRNIDIAEILNITPKSVGVTLVKIRKQKEQAKK